MSRLTKQFANVLLGQGVHKGDRILIMLPRIPEWQIALVGALRIGAVPIPCIEMLTTADLKYRLEHSGATAIVCRASQVEKFETIASDITARIALGAVPDWADWADWAGEMEAASQDVVSAEVASEDPAINVLYLGLNRPSKRRAPRLARALHLADLGGSTDMT